jgi:hypothetical protein
VCRYETHVQTLGGRCRKTIVIEPEMRNPEKPGCFSFCKCLSGTHFNVWRNEAESYEMRVMVPQWGHFIWLEEKMGDNWRR